MKSNKNAGYSLLELLIVLTILGLITAIAIPAVSAWRGKQELHSLRTGLFHMTSKARYLAMTSQSRVTVCALSAQGQCQQSWAGIISSFIDSNGNRRLDPGEEVLHTLYIPQNINLYWRGMQPTNSIHFSSQGVTFVSNGTMSLCSTGSDSGTMTINRQGRPKLTQEGARCPD